MTSNERRDAALDHVQAGKKAVHESDMEPDPVMQRKLDARVAVMVGGQFWKRTIEIFRAAPVAITLESKATVIGDIVFVGDDHCTVVRPDGSHARVLYERIHQVIEATPKL